MLGSLERGDRLLLIGAGVLFALVTTLAAVLGRPAADDGEPLASSWSGSAGGGLAAFRLLGSLTRGVERWERSPEDLALETGDFTRSEAYTLVVAQPAIAPTRREREAIERFVRTGGRLVVTGDPLGLAPGATVQHTFAEDTLRWPRAEAGGAARRAESVRMRATGRWTTGVVDGEQVRFARKAVPGVVEYPLGAGTVVWWAGPMPLANRGLTQADNLALFLDSIGGSGETFVLWDEYFHGSRGRVIDYLLRTPLKWALVQLALVFAVVCATWARRFLPARVPASESRASRLEFVDALGGLYARAGAAAVAVRVLHDDVRLRLARRLGLPTSASSAALADAAARRLGAGGPALAQLLDRTAHAGDEDAGTSTSEALALVQALDRWDRRWQTVAGAGRPGGDTRTEGA